MLKQYHLKDYHVRLIILITILSIIGIMVIGSARESVQDKQIMGLILGLFAIIIISLIDYRFVLNFYWIMYIANIVLLVAVRLAGDTAGGAMRWIEIGSIRFQPSELSKLVIIIFFAQFFMKYKESLNTIKTLILSAILIAVPLVLIKIQPDLSTTIVVSLIFIIMIYVGGLSYKIIGGILAVAIPSSVILISILLQPTQTLIKGYQYLRIMSWLQPEKYAEKAYQQQNSIMAIGSGQLFGKGLNNNVVSSVKNGNFISEPQTDFIFAVAGEELGFVGGCIIIILLLLITLECILIARKANDLAGRLICIGMASWVGLQSFINICVVTGLMPTTGLPLPFVSYGLTSLVSLCMGMGLVLNVGLQPKNTNRR